MKNVETSKTEQWRGLIARKGQAMLIDIQEYNSKMARNEAISNNDVAYLLKELAHFRGCTAYLASFQAETLKSLPKSASKSDLRRHVELCRKANRMLDGNAADMRYSTDPEVARIQCLQAVLDMNC